MKIFVETDCCRDELVVDEKDKIVIKRINNEIITYINDERVGIVSSVRYKKHKFTAEEILFAINKPIKASLTKKPRYKDFLVLFAYDNTLPYLIENVPYQTNKYKKEKKKKKPNNKTILINSINTMLKNNDKGCSGLCEDYWEYSIMEENFNWSKHSQHKFCPYDKETLFGCNAKSDGGCFYRCQLQFMKYDKEHRAKVLKLFLEDIQNDRYVTGQPTKALLNNKEIKQIEQINNKEKDKLRKKSEEQYRLRKKTEISFKEHEIVFYGSHKDNILQEMYYDLAELIENLPYHQSNITVNKKAKSFEFTETTGYFEVIQDSATLDNSAFTLSLFTDYQTGKDMFFFSPFINEQAMAVFEATDKAKKIYYKWVDFKKQNPTKNIYYNKASVQEILDTYISKIRQIECETCLFADHCYGLNCLKPQNEAEQIRQHIEELEEQFIVNLHILEACNYRCKHCFAHFDHMNMLPISTWKHVVDNVGGTIFVKRFNIAGGEPLLYPHIDELIQYIYNKGYEVSIITNGLLLTDEWLEKNAKYIDTIGISVDSFNEETLLAMGRKTLKNEFLSPTRLIELCKKIKQYGIKLKLNTVVTKLNYKEDFTQIIKELDVDRWKVLKMKIFKNESFDNSDISISKKTFNTFVSKHKNVNNAVFEESLVNSYIMIDASGALVDNSGDSYTKLIDVTSEDFEEGFKQLNLDKTLYFSRYQTT